jgi:TonB family protein
MKGSSASFVLPAVISLVFHAGVLLIAPRFASPGAPHKQQVEIDEIVIADPSDPAPAIPEPKGQEPELPAEFVIGAAEGRGFASHQIDDPQAATAREANTDQAYLSLDPRGAGDQGTQAAVVSVQGEGSTRGEPGGAPMASGVNVPKNSASALLSPFGVGQELKLPQTPPKLTTPENVIAQDTGPASPESGQDAMAQTPEGPPLPSGPDLELRKGEQTTAPPVDAPVAPVVSAAPGSPTPGGAQQPAADPARMSDSESDAFSQLGTVVFRDGGLDVRAGRKIKTKRPKLLLAARIWDAIVIQRPEVTLKIDTDETGKVTSVIVLKSSGSNEIDQPTRVAVYDWWFEPKVDAKGHPLPDQFKFVIGYR